MVLGYGAAALATPSTNFWTPCTTYIQPYGVPHLTYDSYFNRTADFPTDTGLTIGLLPWKKFQAEAGFDLFLPGPDPEQFNFKAGFPEDALFKQAPGFTFGIFGMGFHNGVNNYDVVHVNLGKTVSKLGTFAAGGYYGLTRDLMRSSDGGNQDGGYMLSYYRTLEPWTDRIALSADYLSGKNILGGGGVGLYWWFTKQIDVITGWVWFNDTELNPFPTGAFTIQLDVDIDFKRMLPK
jgi:hypothetical protein